jgi:hypothetical protein
MAESGGDLLFAQARSVVAADRQRDATAFIEMARPDERAVQAVEFPEQHPLLSSDDTSPPPGGPLTTRYRMAAPVTSVQFIDKRP